MYAFVRRKRLGIPIDRLIIELREMKRVPVDARGVKGGLRPVDFNLVGIFACSPGRTHLYHCKTSLVRPEEGNFILLR